jgi:hypothetical protein
MTQQLPAEFPSRSIGDYLAALSSGAPTPGGGSAAGLAGALGCSLGAMVCNLTLAKQQDEMISTLARRFTGMAKQLIELAERDEQAFGMYRDAIALPKSAEEEKASRCTSKIGRRRKGIPPNRHRRCAHTRSRCPAGDDRCRNLGAGMPVSNGRDRHLACVGRRGDGRFSGAGRRAWRAGKRRIEWIVHESAGEPSSIRRSRPFGPG